MNELIAWIISKLVSQSTTWGIPNFFAPIFICWLLCLVNHDISDGGYIIVRLNCLAITASLPSTIA